MRRLAILFLAATAALSARADVTPGPLFTDHAVLQRDTPVPVWGRARPGEEVTVTFGAQTLSTKTPANGRWQVTLAPMPASAVGTELVIAGTNTVTLRDVLVGEVWLCGGQSNMDFPVKWARDSRTEIAASAEFPAVRHFKVAQRTSPQPAARAEGTWRAASPATTGEFSATAYYFARELNRELGVPVGVINASWGGTPIEAWMSEKTLRSDPAFKPVWDRLEKTTAEWPETVARYRADTEAWKQASEAAKAANRSFNDPRPRQPVGPGHPYMPMLAHNGMVYPLPPYALAGALWYQGGANVRRASEYEALFVALINQWRADWREDLPFYFAQLANYKGDDPEGRAWAELREAQAAVLRLPRTGMAVTIDIGDRDDIHPRNKQEVGRRFALLALAKNHGVSVEFSGPVFKRAERAGNGLRLHFDHAAGLTAPGGEAPGFELAGPDGRFVPAVARVERDGTVLVSASGVSAPSAVRYAWSNSPAVSLVNAAGLPAAPFRAGSH